MTYTIGLLTFLLLVFQLVQNNIFLYSLSKIKKSNSLTFLLLLTIL